MQVEIICSEVKHVAIGPRLSLNVKVELGASEALDAIEDMFRKLPPQAKDIAIATLKEIR